MSSDIYSIAKTTIKLDEYSRILDFGCGCGRVIQHFQELYKNASFYGVDIDKEAILWCQNHLSKIGEFSANEQSPPLLFKDDFLILYIPYQYLLTYLKICNFYGLKNFDV